MNDLSRRAFVKTSLATAAVAALPATAAAAVPGASGQYIELRAYRLKDITTDHAPLDAYLQEAFIPALNRRGIDAVGVFTEPEAKDGAAVWVLIPHPSLDSVVSVDATINVDPEVLAKGAAYLTGPTKDKPAFERIDSWLYLPFEGLPQLAVPARAKQREPRMFELRTYESYSELKALNKVAMFNAGEIGLMQELNLSPVFYGQCLLGKSMPHLTYMLCSPDRATHDKNWKAFAAHPVWNKLKNDPQYQDNVSHITSRFLVPASYSQI
jgi:hypothetical protein